MSPIVEATAPRRLLRSQMKPARKWANSSQCIQKKETKMFFVISSIKLGRFCRNLVYRFLN